MSSWKWADGRKYISSPNGWVEIGSYDLPAEDDDWSLLDEWTAAMDWYHFGMGGTGASGVTIPDPVEAVAVSDDTPPRHSADDYKDIAERLKQLGYRGWITG